MTRVIASHRSFVRSCRTLAISGKDCVRFADLLVGLAAMQPGAVHGACVAEVRCRFIFRLYDRDSDMFLDHHEFRCVALALFFAAETMFSCPDA